MARHGIQAAAMILCALFISCSASDLDIPDPFSDVSSGEKGSTADNNLGSNVETDNSGDYVSGSSFDRTVKVVFSKTGNATVTGNSSSQSVTVSGNDVTVVNNGDEVVIYELSGASDDGFFKLYSSKKQQIRLAGLSLKNPSGAAINNQSHKRTFVVLSGSNNLADGAVNSYGDYPDQSADEDMKAAFFSEGQLIFSGDGSLSVTATGKAGITSDDYVRFLGGKVSVNSTSGNGVRGKEAIIVTDGDIDVSVSATGSKGFSSDTLVFIGGGSTTISATGSAGTVDGELKGSACIKADARFEMAGGSLTLTSTGTGSKGISCDNVGYIKGGTINIKVTGSNYGSSSSGGGPGGFPGGWGGSSSSSNSVSSKGMKFDGNLYIEDGEIYSYAKNHEAIEAKGTITVTGGTVRAESGDDAINSGCDMTISGGHICAISTGNDGLDSNGNLYIKGGVVYAVGSSSPEVAIDANTEQGYKFYLSGGTLIAIGGIENGSNLSQGAVSTSWNKNTKYALYDGSSLLYAFTTPSSGGNTMVLSAPGMKSGSTYSLSSGTTISGGTSWFDGLYVEKCTASGGNSASLKATTSISGGGGGGFGGR